MARRGASTPSGLVLFDKPAGPSSFAIVRDLRERTGARAGHAGTLDPLATGVLVVCVGQATRLIQYVQQMRKRYRATFLLGHTSESDDTERELVAIPNAVVPTLDQINAALPQFVGDIQQRPPAHSAIKIGGKRAYKLARKGADFELPERTITVYQINILRYEYPALEIDVECGSGTYIRSLGRDLGAALGTGGVMSALERTATGPFKVADAIRPDDLSVGSIAKRLQPAQLAVAHMPQTTVTDAELVEIRNGRPIALRPAVAHQPEWAGIDTAGELAAILHSKRGQLWPTHNFSA